MVKNAEIAGIRNRSKAFCAYTGFIVRILIPGMHQKSEKSSHELPSAEPMRCLIGSSEIGIFSDSPELCLGKSPDNVNFL